jgi:protoporphyrin/coproporphyrin ferrochelatase
MKTAVLFLSFGEPEHATMEEVVPFLERIFLLNMPLEGEQNALQKPARARQLAEQRAPGLIHEYEEIGGSPMNEQAKREAESTISELRRRGHDVRGYVGMQFTDPTIDSAVERARADGAELVVMLPTYPVCGPSTTVAALQQASRALKASGWDVPVREISGWHSHTAYLQLRADAIRRVVIDNDLDLTEPRTRLVFSAHGTPIKYLQEGSRYELYTQHSTRAVAELLGAEKYELGYQNHTNRPIEWTQPDIDKVIERVDAETVVVDPCSFMHEQSETLAELDHELKEKAEERGLNFYRVPIPHDDTHFIQLLADLIEPFITGKVEEAGFRPCRCRSTPNTFCLNTVL